MFSHPTKRSQRDIHNIISSTNADIRGNIKRTLHMYVPPDMPAENLELLAEALAKVSREYAIEVFNGAIRALKQPK